MKRVIILLLVFSTHCMMAQGLVWTGNANTADFFDENNWIDTSTNAIPPSGTLSAGNPITTDLTITDASESIVANGIIQLSNANLSIENSEVSATAIQGGELHLNYDTYVTLTDATPVTNTAIHLNSPIAWLKFSSLSPDEIEGSLIDQMDVNGVDAAYQTNLRLDNYYLDGSIIRSIADTDKPLEVFTDENLNGNTALIGVDVIWSSQSDFNSQPIPNGLNNQISSFVLKKGYMATFAVNEDGTGKSKNYIASEEDLVINEIPNFLNNQISFIRVLPWNWVTKKGRGGGGTSAMLDNTWFYHWNNNMNSTLPLEYAPMSWGANGANSDAAIQNYLTKYKSTHVLAFNESDNCNDQSGQFNDLCQVPVAVNIYENLMKTGMRLVSPNGRENAPFGWLLDFYNLANQNDIRIDVIGVHWYDWGSNPQNSPNANPQAIFNRFVNYLEDVHELYNLPIWITEFNANPNRTNQVNYEFMQLALPYLESLDYVERYAWFEPFSGTADYTDANGNLTNVGTFYTNQVSTPSVSEPIWTENNNLENYLALVDPTGENLIINGFFETGDLFGWEGSNIGILTNNNANIYEGTTSGRILANAGELFQLIEVEPNTVYEVSLFNRWFVPPSEAIDIKIINTADNSIMASQPTTTNTNWNSMEFEFTTPSDVSEIKFSIEKGNEPGWFIDNAVMLKIETLSAYQPVMEEVVQVFPNPSSASVTVKAEQFIKSIRVVNFHGQVVEELFNLNNKETILDVSKLNVGTYILQIHTHIGKSFSKKIVIQ